MSERVELSPQVLGALRVWWKGLDDDRGARAELRRCATLLDVLQCPAFHAARLRLQQAGLDERSARNERLALVIGLLSHLKSDQGRSAPDAFSISDDGRPPVSPLRFRQILASRDDDELYRLLRRVLPLVDSGLSLERLATDLAGWGDRVRKAWVYDYAWPQKQTA